MKLSYVSILFIVAFATSGIKSQSVTDNLIDGKLSVKMKLTSKPIMHVIIKGVISCINVIDHHLVKTSKGRFKHSLYTHNMYNTIVILSQPYEQQVDVNVVVNLIHLNYFRVFRVS